MFPMFPSTQFIILVIVHKLKTSTTHGVMNISRLFKIPIYVSLASTRESGSALLSWYTQKVSRVLFLKVKPLRVDK